jgi:1-acyl-sn-glycerol-3-phosphate acyltransferase
MSIFSEVFPRQTVVIGKKEVIYIPFWGQMYVAFGNIIIDRKDVKNSVAGLNKAAELVKKKSLSVWIFPEGTRNQSGVGLLPFKKGAFHLALQAQVPIVPIVASNLNPVLNFKERKVHGGTLKVQILSPISTHGMRIDQVNELMNSVREQMLVAKSQLDS